MKVIVLRTLPNMTSAQLLKAMNTKVHRLSAQEIEALVSHIESTAKARPPTYTSKNFGIGHKRPAPEMNSHIQSPQAPRAMEHLDVKLREALFSFICSDIRIEEGLSFAVAWIVIPGIDRPFYHYQVYLAFYLLIRARSSIRGIINSDLMGLGKVSSILLSRTYSHA